MCLCFALQDAMWKEWHFLAKFVGACGQRGVDAIRRVEASGEQVTTSSLRCMRGLKTDESFEAVIAALQARTVKMKDVREASAHAQLQQWLDWQWRGACYEGLVPEEKSMWVGSVASATDLLFLVVNLSVLSPLFGSDYLHFYYLFAAVCHRDLSAEQSSVGRGAAPGRSDGPTGWMGTPAHACRVRGPPAAPKMGDVVQSAHMV